MYEKSCHHESQKTKEVQRREKWRTKNSSKKKEISQETIDCRRRNKVRLNLKCNMYVVRDR